MSGEQCCERDHNHDGNCDIHSAPGVFRIAALNRPTDLNLCVSCGVANILKRYVYVRLDGGPNIVCANVSGAPPLDPMPPANRIGPFCETCQETKLDELRRGNHG